jgi:hypothetical protein
MIRLLERDQDGARGKMLYSQRQRPRVSPVCRGAEIDPGPRFGAHHLLSFTVNGSEHHLRFLAFLPMPLAAGFLD